MERFEKSAEVAEFLESMFGRTTAIENEMCVSCKEDIREYAISGLCQQCQDGVFGAGS